MSKKTKIIFYGISAFVLAMVIVTVGRSLIKSTPFVDELKDWTNWAVAALGGVLSAIRAWYMYKEKEKNEK